MPAGAASGAQTNPWASARRVKGFSSGECIQWQPWSNGRRKVTVSVKARPPIRSRPSSTRTRLPDRSSLSAAARPATPAPTTMTSYALMATPIITPHRGACAAPRAAAAPRLTRRRVAATVPSDSGSDGNPAAGRLAMTKTRPMMSALLGALACLIARGPVHAYPISPVPLWEVTEEADLIVLGVVSEVRGSPDAGEQSLRGAPSASRMGGPGSLARIEVREVWKGNAGSRIEVSFDSNLICPAPPRYEAGKVVAAFLTREGDRLHTVGLSYGTLYPATQEVGDFRDRVKEAVGLQKAGVVDPRERVAWHVRAAARPATRWHGLYGLKPSGDSLH